MKFLVITKVSAPETGGNMACDLEVYQVTEGRLPENAYTEQLERVPPMVCLNLRTPVFHVGEVIIVNDDGREIPYPGRKASKWDVNFEVFDELYQALDRCKEVGA